MLFGMLDGAVSGARSMPPSRRCRPRSARHSCHSEPCTAAFSRPKRRRASIHPTVSGGRPASPGDLESETPAQLAAGLGSSSRRPTRCCAAMPSHCVPDLEWRSSRHPQALADRATGAPLGSLARTGSLAQLALRRAAQLLSRHADDRARAALAEVNRPRRGSTPERWLAALDATACRARRDAVALPSAGVAPAFWPDGQRPGGCAARRRGRRALAPEARSRWTWRCRRRAGGGARRRERHPLRRGRGGGPATCGAATSSQRRRTRARRHRGTVLRALALAGVALPDAEPERFFFTTGPSRPVAGRPRRCACRGPRRRRSSTRRSGGRVDTRARARARDRNAGDRVWDGPPRSRRRLDRSRCARPRPRPCGTAQRSGIASWASR